MQLCFNNYSCSYSLSKKDLFFFSLTGEAPVTSSELRTLECLDPCRGCPLLILELLFLIILF